jgi:uncharacterized protein YbjQ (UPF0145 family)
MKLFLSSILFFTLFFSLSASNNSIDSEKDDTVYDTIIRMGGRKLVCKVLNIRPTLIYYHLPGKPEEKLEIERKQVERIKYGSGKIEVLNNPAVMSISEDSWQAVVVTDDPSMTEFMYEIGKVDGESAANSRNIKAAKQSAQIKLQKKAANLGANVVFLIKVEAKGGYGEFPSYYMEGIAYSFDPPVNNPKK